MEVTKEQINKVSRYANVSEMEAAMALERSGGCTLDAVLLLEQEGKIPRPPISAWSTRCNAPPPEGEPQASYFYFKPGTETGTLPRRLTGKEVWKAIKSLLRNCMRITIDVWRRDDLLVGIPLVICVLRFVVSPYIMIPLTLIGLCLGYRYHISGWDAGAEFINQMMDQITDAVSNWASELVDELKKHHHGHRSKK